MFIKIFDLVKFNPHNNLIIQKLLTFYKNVAVWIFIMVMGLCNCPSYFSFTMMRFFKNKLFWKSMIHISMRVTTNYSSKKSLFQSLGYPSLRPQPEGSKIIRVPDGPYGAPNLMLNGYDTEWSIFCQPFQFWPKELSFCLYQPPTWVESTLPWPRCPNTKSRIDPGLS